MNRYELSKAGINTNEGIKRFNGNITLYEELLYKFKDDKNFSEMCSFIKNKKIKEAFYSAHALKGIAGNLSFNTLYEHLVPIVETLRKNSLDNIEYLLQPLIQDYNNIIKVIG